MVKHLKMMLTSAILLLSCDALLGDTLILKDDSKIDGVILSKTNGQIVIRTGSQVKTVPYTDIKLIMFPKPLPKPRFYMSFNFLGTIADAIHGMFGLDFLFECALGGYFTVSLGTLVLPIEGYWGNDTSFAASLGFRAYPLGLYRSFYLGAECIKIFGDYDAIGVMFSFGYAGTISKTVTLSGGIKFRFLEYPYERDIVLNMNVGMAF